MSNAINSSIVSEEQFFNSTPVSASFATISTHLSCSSNAESTDGPNYGLFFTIVLVSIATVIGNVMVIASILIFRKLRRVSSMFIISLASADLIMGGIVMPLSSHYLLGSKWLLGPLVCDLWTSIDVLTVTASICTLCAISIDRYMAITKPFQYSKQVTRKASRIAVALIWIISGVIAFIPINLGWWKTNEPCDLRCYQDTFCCEFLPNKTYAIVSSLISFYAPLTAMVFAYSIVLKSKCACNCLNEILILLVNYSFRCHKWLSPTCTWSYTAMSDCGISNRLGDRTDSEIEPSLQYQKTNVFNTQPCSHVLTETFSYSNSANKDHKILHLKVKLKESKRYLLHKYRQLKI